jgi:predicted PurR-regulated permease PerM
LAHGAVDIRSASITGLFILALFYALYFARDVFLPITVALLFSFLLRPAVRGLKRLRIPPAIGAGLVMLGLLGVLGLGMNRLAQPASDWLSTLRESLPEINTKLRHLLMPVQEAREAAEQVEEMAKAGEGAGTLEVQVKGPSLIQTFVGGAQRIVAWIALTLLLLYFMLAYGDLLLQKIIHILPRFEHKKRVLDIAGEIESNVSTYLATVTLMNSAVGIAIGIETYFIGLPNPILWGVMAGLLEFVPYLGPMVGILIVSFVSVLSFETIGQALLAPSIYLVLDTIQGNFIATMVLGRRFSINPVVLLVWLIFWSWLWGIAGALLAVPMLAAFKIFCDHIEPLSIVGKLIAN